MSTQARALAESLIAETAMYIDRLEFDRWIDSFEPTGQYFVVPRENRDRGYPAALIYCNSRDMIADRISALLKVNKFNPHVDRHIVSRPFVIEATPALVKAETNFMIVQSNAEGVSKLFCAGVYEDVIAVDNGMARFRTRHVVLDTFCVPNLIATPI